MGRYIHLNIIPAGVRRAKPTTPATLLSSGQKKSVFRITVIGEREKMIKRVIIEAIANAGIQSELEDIESISRDYVRTLSDICSDLGSDIKLSELSGAVLDSFNGHRYSIAFPEMTVSELQAVYLAIAAKCVYLINSLESAGAFPELPF